MVCQFVAVHFLLQEAWYAFHPHKAYVRKFMKPLIVGRVPETVTDVSPTTKKTVSSNLHVFVLRYCHARICFPFTAKLKLVICCV